MRTHHGKGHSATYQHPVQVVRQRLENVSNDLLANLSNISSEELLSLLALSDNDFLTELRYRALANKAIHARTPEKDEQQEFAENRIAFLESLQPYGGVHKSNTVRTLLSLSIPTIHKYGKQNKLIVLEWGVENLYPVFQFSVKEKLSEKGMLKGVPQLLSHMKNSVSSVRKCNFFTRRIELPHSGEETSALSILLRGATEEEMDFLIIQAESFGTNHAV